MNTRACIGSVARPKFAKPATVSDVNLAMAERLSTYFEWITINPGEVIIREGDPSDFLLLVVDGNLEMTKSGKISQQRLGYARPGSIIGEMGIFTSEPRCATCRATTASKVGLLTRERIQQLQTQDIELYLELVVFLGAYIARRLAQVSKMVGTLKQQNEIAALAATRIFDIAMTV